MRRIFLYGMLALLGFVCLQNVQASDDYHFAVLGDRTGGANQEAFEMVLRDMERLHPDFIVTVGDQIEGYQSREVAIKEWDEILESMKVITCPVFYTAGNHDIYCEVSEEVFSEKTGFKPYYTFDYENSHFVILNNAIAENFEEMDKEQIQWLEKDLRENRDKENIFVFMHKPFWANVIAEGKEDKMHNIFKKNNVDAVFTGHWHQYASNEYDGIKYILVGSSGGSWGGEENVGLGMFYQFMWCKVDGDKLQASIIKAGNIYNDDLVTIEEEKMSYKIPTNLISFDAEKIFGQKKKVVDVTVTIINNTDKTIKSDITFKYDKNWDVRPDKKSPEIEKGDTLKTSFKFVQKGSFYPVPRMEFVYPFGRDKQYEYSHPAWIQKMIICPGAKKAPVIDGKIGKREWKGAGVARVFAGFGESRTKADDTEVYFMHDDENLYIYARCYDREMDKLKARLKERDDQVYTDDAIGFMFSPNEKNVYHIYISALGTIWDQKVYLEKYKKDISWNGKYEVKCEKGKDSWVMEFKIPFSEIGLSGDETEIKMNIRRKQQRNNESALWMSEWSHNPSVFGGLLLR